MKKEYIVELTDEEADELMDEHWVGDLVRCKNCKYHYVDGGNVRYNMCLLLHNKAQPDDWFCADGERKE